MRRLINSKGWPRGPASRRDGAALLRNDRVLLVVRIAEGRVAAIDVGPELGEAGGGGKRREIDEMHGHGSGELDVELLAAVDLRLHLVQRPAVLGAEQPGDELLHLLHPHAAGGEGARALAEQLLERRVVHVDAVLVGHVDAHDAERVEGAGFLAKLVAHHLRRIPIDRGRIERRRLPVAHDREVLFAEIARILSDLRDEVLLGDDLRHAPGREEIDLDDLGRHLRGCPRGLAGDDVAVERELAVLHALRHEERHVDQHVARRLVEAHQALHTR